MVDESIKGRATEVTENGELMVGTEGGPSSLVETKGQRKIRHWTVSDRKDRR